MTKYKDIAAKLAKHLDRDHGTEGWEESEGASVQGMLVVHHALHQFDHDHRAGWRS